MLATDASVAAKPASAKFAAADALWVLSFVLSWGLLLALWNTWWAFPLTLLFLCHLAGLSEFVHQTVHQNLFARSRRWNRALGKIAGALISVDFDTYRVFHLNHHRFTNTPEDPERPFYENAEYLEIVAGWRELSAGRKLRRILRLARYAAVALASFGGNRPFVRFVRWSVPISIAGTGYLQGLAWYLILAKLIVAWQLPLLMLLFVDMAFAQSEHYMTKDAEGVREHGTVPLDAQYALSWNLGVPAALEFFLLKRNVHAEHHLTPSIHWTRAFDGGRGRMLPLREYLRSLWTQGPRA